MSITENKQRLREIAIKRRKEIDFRAEKDCKICDYVVKLLLEKNVRSLFIYVSMESEVNTIGIIDKFISRMRIYVPHTYNGQMFLVPIEEKTTLTGADKFGNVFCNEQPPRMFLPEQVDIDVSVVPMCAYDKKFFRLGYGGGYYDKYLSRADCFSVGLSYSEMYVDSLPVEEHDVALSAIVTDQGVYYRDSDKSFSGEDDAEKIE